MDRLKDKVAVVTGGGRGIGRAIVERFRDEGAKIAIFGRTAQSLKEVRADIGGDVVTVVGDVTSVDDLARLFAVTNSELGPIDVVVANAASQRLVAVDDMTSAELDELLGVVLKSVYLTVQQAIPFLAERASVVLIGSSAATRGWPAGNTVYQAGKAGVRALARGLSAELHGRGVRVNVLSPGLTRTDMVRSDPARHQIPAAEALALYNEALRQIPLGRPADPHEIAAGVVFLASDDSSYMLGSELVIDGGMEQV